MVKITIFIAMTLLLLPGLSAADSNYFRGTRTGLSLSEQVFSEGFYKEQNLFLIIGTGPTVKALRKLRNLKSKTTFLEDLGNGADDFSEQLSKAGDSIPDNFSSLGKNITALFVDPVKDLRDFNIITPASIVYHTVANSVKTLWYTTLLVTEPVARVGYGTASLSAAPFIKPVSYTGVALAYGGTALYGYSSSAVAGTVMLGATGAVLALDTVTTPAVALYETVRTDKDEVKESINACGGLEPLQKKELPCPSEP